MKLQIAEKVAVVSVCHEEVSKSDAKYRLRLSGWTVLSYVENLNFSHEIILFRYMFNKEAPQIPISNPKGN